MSFRPVSDTFQVASGQQKSGTVVYVAMGIDIMLLGDSMKWYKLATFSCKLGQHKS